MIKKLQITCAFLILISLSAVAQTGAIKGKIYDKATKEPLAFASVVAEQGNSQKGGGQSDFDGEFTIKPLAAGDYTIRISYVGYNDLVITGVLVSNDKITFQDLAMSKKVVETKEVEIVAYKVPLIDKGNPSTTSTATREDIAAAPSRDIRAVAATTAGVFQRDDNDDLNVRGSRTDATDFYIDGVKVRGSKNLPKDGVEQISVISGGVPAQYGDATGGIVSITTRGPSEKFGMGINLETSELFDEFGHNLVSLSLSGPILTRKMDDGSKKSLIGFFLAGDLALDADPDPSAIGMYQLNDDKYSELSSNPLNIIPPSGNNETYSSTQKAEYLRADNFSKIKTKLNTEQMNVAVSGKIDFQPNFNNIFSIGGSFNHQDRNTFNIDRAIYNYEENPQRIDLDWRVFARFTKKIGGTYDESEKSASVIRNTYFSIQASYGVNKITIQDEDHKNNFWRYGYRGKFENNFTRVSDAPVLAAPGGLWHYYANGDSAFYHHSSTYSTINNYSYTPSGINPLSEAYTLSAVNAYPSNNFADLSLITNAGGLLNGRNPSTVYSEWQSIGTQFNRFTENDNQSYRFTFSGNTDIKNHALSLGFEFEQRIDRAYDIFPNAVWIFGGQYNNPTFFSYANTVIGDTLYENAIPTYQTQAVKTFYERLHDRLGVPYNQVIDFDALTPDQLDEMSLDVFTADQLISNLVINSYAGYDYAGRKTTNNSTLHDFFNKKEDGVFTREVGAFKPIYMAGYIQDNFAIEDLNFNVGLRVDRFDANQPMLKDKYSLYDIKSVEDVNDLGKHPDNVKGDYAVYVDNEISPTRILGYRNGDVWYDPQGRIVSDPTFLANENSGKLVPYLVNPSEGTPDGGITNPNGWNPDNSFVDYEPQYSVMPRVAFSFPISDQAMFFAHYNVLTQRPAERLRLDPIVYIQEFNTSSFVNNPNLKPERSTHYELGFKQVLSKSSALSISAFYEEKKNLIQVVKIPFAMPAPYTTYDNVDFASIKGFTFGFDLRRTGNIRMTANYTMQFADGTGSGVNSNLELAETDQPNIRIILPLDFDQRHLMTLNFDYRYGKGSDYNGPILGGSQIFSNAGFNMQLKAGSGTPYTRQSRPTQEGNAIGWQDNGQRAVSGSINGGRMPWTFSVDFKVDKDFEVKLNDSKTLSFNVYFQMQNALNTKNITKVYRATGNADDDGFINTADGQLLANSSTDPQAFKDQYYLKLQNPDYYTIPRRSRIGVNINF